MDQFDLAMLHPADIKPGYLEDKPKPPGIVRRGLAALGQTWPARLVADAVEATKAPGKAWRGEYGLPGSREFTENAIKPAADLAGLVMGGSYVAPAVKGGVGMGIRAYHGSPHDFDKFDLAKIGTGEGAQAYGHGLYFAEKPAVAEEYKRSLTESALEEYYRKLRETGRAERPKPPEGKMYEVDIKAHPDQFLDWDKPLAEQPHVVGALHKAGYSVPQKIPTADELAMLESKYGEWGKMQADAWRDLTKKTGSEFRPHNTETINKLAEAGIPGIKYLDQGSRAAGDGSRNYVVFDPSLIEIMRKYGLAGLTAGPAAYGAMNSQPDQ